MEEEDDDQFAGISGMHDKISNLELEEKERNWRVTITK